MIDFSFSTPVRIKAGLGLTHEVRSVRSALESLNGFKRRGRKWDHAAEVCAGAMVGGNTPDEARAAFEAAAKEVGVLIG